ncbi:MAG: FAD-binding protein [Deltaproteobacteria bacterium]|nr:FAD-binding protein [Deltaproteobacteria bacterium]MBW2135958.1 FAD-binding protein [Deltaproteobacteria bacterium]
MREEIRKALQEIVGAKNCRDQLIDLVSYSYDASDHAKRPECAVFPSNTKQVSRIMELANKHRIPVIPRGAGTSLTGSVVPVMGGIVLDLCKMNRIIDVRIADRLAVVEPGVVYGQMEKELAPHGFFFPPDPASSQVCTLGGNVATNAGGMRGAKYGVTRDYVLGLEVVLADGRVMRTGTRCMKSASGYDLTRLFVGSEGTLGVITEITLKISPMPKAVKTALAHFESLEDAGKSVTDIMHSGIIPSVLEILDENTIGVLRERAAMNIPDIRAMILVETDGYTDGEASFQMDKIVEIFNRHGASFAKIAKTAEETEELWQARKSAGSVAAQLRPNNVSEDVTVPMSKVPELLTRISDTVRRYGLPFVIFGHAGDGNLHPRIMYDKSDPEQVEALERAVEDIFKLACDLGGTLTGEHGVGLAKAPFMHLEHDPVAMQTMKALKETFDPNNILNPGKMGL